jgi:hypothetical protein
VPASTIARTAAFWVTLLVAPPIPPATNPTPTKATVVVAVL